MKKITKAVIPAAGLGTRMLPIAKAVPKETLPIVDKPAVHYLVEEAVRSGVTDICIITGRDKGAIEDYFDLSPEYEAKLRQKEDTAALYEELRRVSEMANIYYIRQKEARGLGHAVLCARTFVGGDDFLVLYGDDVIVSDVPVCRQLADTYANYGGECAVVGVNAVPEEKLAGYCSLKVSPAAGRSDELYVSDMIEKPKRREDIFSNYAILGRVLLKPEIFGILENQAPGHGGEIQLTDAMRAFARKKTPPEYNTVARVFEGVRHDIGSKLGFLIANVTEGVKHPQAGAAFAAFLREFVKGMPNG